MNIKDFTTDQLTAELEARGYYLGSMWQLEDARAALNTYNYDNDTEHELSDEELRDALSFAISNGGTTEGINELIGEHVEAIISSRNSVTDAAGNTCVLYVNGIEFDAAKSLLENNGLLDDNSLFNIDSYHFFGDKYFYRDIQGGYVCEYSNVCRVFKNYSDAVEFVEQLEF